MIQHYKSNRITGEKFTNITEKTLRIIKYIKDVFQSKVSFSRQKYATIFVVIVCFA